VIISKIDLKDSIVLLEFNDEENISGEEFKKFSQQLKKFGASNVIGLSNNIKLTSLDDENLKKLGLQKIKGEENEEGKVS